MSTTEPCAVGRQIVGDDLKTGTDMRTPCPNPASNVRLLWNLEMPIRLCESHLHLLIFNGDVNA